ncbi:aldo/keto reductase [Actinomadura rifamycini]|uniref:aldo/keto reductase n=1 Tax=Actinomadura rifamycini TaxID=31962 RepID=UPI000550487D|nr:aldo/keto reductase [Actinomadura rifamycini]
MAVVGLGTYRCRDVPTAARAAIATGVRVIDTAPVYAHGQAQRGLAPALRACPRASVSTKVGHMTSRQAEAAQRSGLITASEASRRHSIAPAYLAHQITVNANELARSRLDLLYLHNPEYDAHGDRSRLRSQITQAFEECEHACHQGLIDGYGVATWNGFTDGAFTVEDLLSAARDAAGSNHSHLKGIQLPVSLVQLTPLAEAVNGFGPIAEASAAGLQVWASAPLHGGELVDMITSELAEFIGSDLSPAEAALAVVASTPGLTGVLLSASSETHWRVAQGVFRRPSIPFPQLRRICHVLGA